MSQCCIPGVQLILGLNGVIWVSAGIKQPPEKANASLVAEAQPTVVRDITQAERQAIARVANCIRALAKLYFSIHPASIMNVYTVRMDAICSSLCVEPRGLCVLLMAAAAGHMVHCTVTKNIESEVCLIDLHACD